VDGHTTHSQAKYIGRSSLFWKRRWGRTVIFNSTCSTSWSSLHMIMPVWKSITHNLFLWGRPLDKHKARHRLASLGVPSIDLAAAQSRT